jgi:acyl-CoA synthetase (AMP-forming)/AMP-acid ligase II
VDALAHELGDQPGQRVLIIAPNMPALVIGMFATWRSGGVAVPLSTRLRRFELERVFNDAEPRAVVTIVEHGGFDVANVVRELCASAPSLAKQLVVDEAGRVTETQHRACDIAPEPMDHEASTILYTSGTTGEPKGVVERHVLGHSVAESFTELLGPYAREPCGYMIPVSHSFGLHCLFASIYGGGVAVLLEAVGALEAAVATMRAHRVGVFHGSPAVFSRLLDSAGGPPDFRCGLIAGAVCPPELIARYDQLGTRLIPQYGLTEAGSVSSCRLDDTNETRYRTVGRALRGYAIRTVDVQGSMDPEIQVRSNHIWPSLFRRPWSDEEMTADGWLRTGDLGTLDGDGNLTVAGRAKEVVHTGGFTVHPGEVEAFVHTYPGVAQAVVVGVPHPSLGEALVAFLVPTRDVSFDRRTFTAFCRAGIAGYKVPYRVHLLDELPLLSSGKPDRQALLLEAKSLSR